MSVCVCVCVCAQSLSPVWLLATPWIVTHQALLSMEFPGKNTGVCCHFLLQGIFQTQGWKQSLFKFPVLAGEFFTTWTTWETLSKE